eukprot:scaffold16694_cov125-Isochrysis_galbana.AAC.3
MASAALHFAARAGLCVASAPRLPSALGLSGACGVVAYTLASLSTLTPLSPLSPYIALPLLHTTPALMAATSLKGTPRSR